MALALEWLVVGARGGPRVIFLLLLQFPLQEKIQDLIQSEIPMTNDPSAN